MPDNNQKRTTSQSQEDGVDKTVHAGCGLPVIIGFLLVATFILR